VGAVKDHPDDHLADEFGGMDALDKVGWMIETNGWAIEVRRPDLDADPPVPGYAYSIGFGAAVGFTDVAVFGLSPAASKGLLTLVADACRGGTEIPLGVELVGLLDNELRCVFAPIDLGSWSSLFGLAEMWHGSNPFAIAQLVYPDRNGFMPYEAGYDQRMTFAQPLIGTFDP
jgi:hypothetical protein